MEGSSSPSAPSPTTAHPTLTWSGLAATAALAAAFPLALLALEYPALVASLLVAVGAASAVVGKRR